MKRPLRVLVTGGAGMIGSHVAEHFAKQGARVTALDNLSRLRYLSYKVLPKDLSWNILGKYPRVRRLVGDVRRPRDLREAFRGGADLVVHAAGQVGVQESMRHPVFDCQVNVLGTVRLLEALRRFAPDAALIFLSTNKVYGSSVNRIPVRSSRKRYLWAGLTGVSEDWPVDQSGHTPYGVSKLAADLYVQEYTLSYKMRTAVFRMSCIYGERQLGMSDQGWVAWMALAIQKGWPITIFGSGKQVRDLLYVGDLVRLCERFHSSHHPSGVFNVGGGPRQTASVLEILGRLEKLLKRPAKIRFSEERLFDQRVYISDIRRAQRLLEWFPKIGIDEGLKRLARWVRQNALSGGS